MRSWLSYKRFTEKLKMLIASDYNIIYLILQIDIGIDNLKL